MFFGSRKAQGFLEWLTNRKKSLSQMNRSELRRQELLLEKDRSQLLKKVERISADKQRLFEKGAKERTPELRQILAQEFELKTTEQLMLGRQLNIRSKEMLTVSRLRMLRESADRAGQRGHLGLIGETDLIKLTKLIETDSIKAEVYQERLNEILAIGASADQGLASLGDAGQTVMNIWDKMDAGAITDTNEAYEEADRSVRQRHAAPED